MIVFTIPVAGLASDAGVIYAIRAKLTAACDAAALATARNLNIGTTLSTQISNATTRGLSFFNANFPAGYMGVTNITPNVTVNQSGTAILTVSATATATAPTYFMKFIGMNGQVTGAATQTTRRDVNLMLVLDRSGSMSGQPCTDMVNAATTFTGMFMDGRDRIGMVTFGTEVYNAYPASPAFKSGGATVATALSNITCGGGTNTSDALWQAYQQLVAINQPLALNLIVLFTDGYPTGYSGRFKVKTAANSADPWYAGASPCTDTTDKIGSYVDNLAGNGWGIYNRAASSFGTSSSIVSNSAGCFFASAQYNVIYDMTYHPESDANGVATTGYKVLNRFTGGAYPNAIIAQDMNNGGNVSWNAADNAAVAIRQNATLSPVIYTIGLGSNGGVDDVLLKRIANDPAANNYDAARATGRYIYTPTSGDLANAFAQIASEVLRISK